MHWLKPPAAPNSAVVPGERNRSRARPLAVIPPVGHNRIVTREQAIATLRNRQPELMARGVAHLSLFGSTARGDQRPDSDIDLLAAFDSSRRISLLDIAGLEVRLAALLGCPVDLIEEGTMKQRVSKSAEPDLLRVF